MGDERRLYHVYIPAQGKNGGKRVVSLGLYIFKGRKRNYGKLVHLTDAEAIGLIGAIEALLKEKGETDKC